MAPFVRRGSRGGARVALARHRPHVCASAHVGFVLSGASFAGSYRCDPRPVREELDVARTRTPPWSPGASQGRCVRPAGAGRSYPSLVGADRPAPRAWAASHTPRPQQPPPRPPTNVGLFGSQDPTYDGVYRQSLAVIGLVATGHTPDANAVGWLLAQQCADGAFTAYRATPDIRVQRQDRRRERHRGSHQALVALGKPTGTAVAALKKFQLADGGFYDNTAFGPAASDANSTGLALSALVAAGVDPSTVASSAGKHADDYLRSLQIACAATSGAGAFDFQGEATLHANDYATVQALLGLLGKSLPLAPTTSTGRRPPARAVTDAATSAATAGELPRRTADGDERRDPVGVRQRHRLDDDSQRGARPRSSRHGRSSCRRRTHRAPGEREGIRADGRRHLRPARWRRCCSSPTQAVIDPGRSAVSTWRPRWRPPSAPPPPVAALAGTASVGNAIAVAAPARRCRRPAHRRHAARLSLRAARARHLPSLLAAAPSGRRAVLRCDGRQADQGGPHASARRRWPELLAARRQPRCLRQPGNALPDRPYRYWAYYVAGGHDWLFSQRGPASEYPVDGEVQGWRYAIQADVGTGFAPRAAPDFTSLCRTTAKVRRQLRSGSSSTSACSPTRRPVSIRPQPS